jgi:hypothetical protein
MTKRSRGDAIAFQNQFLELCRNYYLLKMSVASCGPQRPPSLYLKTHVAGSQPAFVLCPALNIFKPGVTGRQC